MNLLKVDDYQVATFTTDNDVPVYLSESDWQLRCYDTDTGKTKQAKYKACELVKELKEEKHMIARGNFKKLQELATNNNIPLHYQK